VIAGVVAVVICAVAAVEARELAPAHAPASPANISALVPAGSCLVADQISFAIAANRFTAPSANCPDVVDSLATTLALSGGVSPQGGAGQAADVVAGWEAIYSKAQYAWVSAGATSRIPWTGDFTAWFASHFHPVATYSGYGDSVLYARDR